MQARLADSEISSDFGDRCGAFTGQLDRALPELRGYGAGTMDILPGGRRPLQGLVSGRLGEAQLEWTAWVDCIAV